MKCRIIPQAALCLATLLLPRLANAYENFRVAVYCRAYEVKEMADPAWLEARWRELSSQVHVDKIYLETHRDLLIVDDATLEAAKAFFALLNRRQLLLQQRKLAGVSHF